jgi:hypothetical protein
MTTAKLFGTRERLRREDPPLGLGGDAPSSAVRSIDRALREFDGRRLVSSAEVVDLLLDLRSEIALDAALQGLSDESEVH